MTTSQIALLLLPPTLILSTYGVFKWMGGRYPARRAYLIGFLFYWIGWCVFLPLILIGGDGVRALFTPADPLFGEPAVIGISSVVLPAVIAPFFTGMLKRRREVTLTVLIASLLFALINGIAEELLWRGTYVTVFPQNWVFGFLYPSLAFGLWHLSPQVIYPAQGGALKFALSAVFLGFAFGWIAFSTSSILLAVISHIVLDLAGLPGLYFVRGVSKGV